MTNLIIIALCTLAGAFGITVMTNQSSDRRDRIIVTSLGAASGLSAGLAIIGIIATFSGLL